jgi:hypothetical protein
VIVFIGRGQSGQVELARVHKGGPESQDALDLLRGTLTYNQLISHRSPSQELSSQIECANHISQFIHNPYLRISITKADSLLDTVGLVKDVSGAATVIKPGEAILPSVIIVEAISLVLNSSCLLFKERTHYSPLVIKLEYAQIGQCLALFRLVIDRTAHSRIIIQVVEGIRYSNAHLTQD